MCALRRNARDEIGANLHQDRRRAAITRARSQTSTFNDSQHIEIGKSSGMHQRSYGCIDNFLIRVIIFEKRTVMPLAR